MRRHLLSLTLLLLTGTAGQLRAEERPIWLACGSKELLRELQPLAEHRRKQGFDVRLSGALPGAAISACERQPRYLLIVGDARPKKAPGDVPSRSGSQYRWRAVQPERFAADPLWSDLNGDRIPDFPVGRIPARTPEAVARVANKTIAFETRTLGPADLGIPVWGGTPDFGSLLDEVATTALQTIIRQSGPDWVEPWMIFGNPRSSLFADGHSQPNLFNERLGRGGFITAMIGHGSSDLFFSKGTDTDDFVYHIGHASALKRDRPSPPHLILACDCGSFANTNASLAEAMLFATGGPVNVVAASTESHPLTNYYSALAILDGLDSGHQRFGDFWHAAQLQSHRSRSPIAETLLKNAEGALEAVINIPKLKADQLLMYNLLGDPATQLPVIQPLEISAAPFGKAWKWEAIQPADASALHLAIRRPSRPVRALPDGSDRETALRLFRERNALWQFQEIARLPADANWQGTLSEPGLVRLVATVPGGLRVATFLIPGE